MSALPRLAFTTSVVALLLTAPALAAPITFGFSGLMVDQIGSVAPGTSIIGTFTFDGNAPVLDDYVNGAGEHVVGYAIDGFSVTVGPETVTMETGLIAVIDGSPDRYLLVDWGNSMGTVGGIEVDSVAFVVGLPASTFAGADLPLTPAFFSDAIAAAVVFYYEASTRQAVALPTGLVIQVPEPGTVGALSAGLLLLGMATLRLRR